MNKIIFLLAFLSFFNTSFSQTVMGRQNVDQFPLSTGGTTYGLTWLPQTYNSTTRRYPLIISLHGAGETGTIQSELSKLYTASPRAIAGRISDGWNAVAVNPLTGVQDSFIVISPQAATWSYDYTELKYILPNILSRYRIDTTRIYLTGLSAGGGGTYTTFGSRDSNFIKKFAAMGVASSAGTNAANGYTSTQVEAGIRYGTQYGVRMWTICGEEDYLLNTGVFYHDSTNKPSPPSVKPNKLTVIVTVGHSAWGRAYDPAFRPTVNYYGSTGNCTSGCNNGGVAVAPNANGSSVMGSGKTQDSLNLYEWFLTNQRVFTAATSPTADAGLDQTITLPANSVSVTGSGTAGDGFTVTSHTWSKISVLAGTITSASSYATTFTGLAQGTHTFRLTVVNSNSVTATDDIQIIVNAAGTVHTSPLVNAGSDQIITLPANSVSLTGTRTLYDGATAINSWQEIKHPGQPVYSIIAIGSSTTACYALTTAECWRTKLSADLKGLGLIDTIYGLGINGGATIFTLNTAASMAVGSNPNKIAILNYPSNGYESFNHTVAQTLARFRQVRDSIILLGYQVLITGTQPREDFATNDRAILNQLNDSIAVIAGDRFINLMKIGKNTANDLWKPEFRNDNNDGIHSNGLFNTEIANAIKAVNPFKYIGASSATFSTPASLTTSVTSISQGTHLFQLAVTDDYGHANTDVMQVTVNGAPVGGLPIANAGINQTLVLPMNYCVLYGGYPYSRKSGSTPISSFSWSQLSGANTAVMSRTRAGVVAINSQDSVVFISGLIAGTYQFRLDVTDDAGTSHDTVQITVTNRPALNPSPKSVTINTGVYYPNNTASSLNLNPGDTLFLNGSTLTVSDDIILGNLNGTAAQPIYIMPKNATVNINRLDFSNPGWGSGGNIKASYIIVDGRGIAGQTYGIAVKQLQAGMVHHFEARNVQSIKSWQSAFHFGGYEIYGNDEHKFPAMNRVGFFIHDNYIDSSEEEGMYLGNTSPSSVGWDTVRYHNRGDSLFVYNNIVKNTGRDAIQAGSFGYVKIFNNSTYNNGLNGVGGQGSAINLGTLCTGEISGNFMRKSWRNGSFINGYSNILYKGNWLDSCAFFETTGNAIIYINTSTQDPERVPARAVTVDSNFIKNPFPSLFTAISGNNGSGIPSKVDSNFIWRPNGGTDFYFNDDAGSTSVGNLTVGNITWPSFPLSPVTGATLLSQSIIIPPVQQPVQRKGVLIKFRIKY